MSDTVAGSVLIDTSAWIEVLRDRSNSALCSAVEMALHENRAAICHPIWIELYRGVRGKREIEQLNSLRRLCQWLDFDDLCWQTAAQVARRCREGGVAVPLGDVLIFACAKRYEMELIEQDQHFILMSKIIKF